MAESLQDQIARQQADRKRELMRLALVEALREGMDRGDDQATIDSNLSRLKRILENQYKIPFSMADGGEMRKGVGSLNNTARTMFRGPKGIASLPKFRTGGEAERLKEIARQLVPAIIQVESSGDPNAISVDGAIGLMQVLPSTAARPGYNIPTIFDLADAMGFSYENKTEQEARRLLFNEKLNVAMGTEYLKGLLAMSDTREEALLKYNAGVGNFADAGGDVTKLDEEAQEYVPKVMAALGGRLIDEDGQVRPPADFFSSPEGNFGFKLMASEDVKYPLRPRARPILGTEEIQPVEGQVTRPRARPSMVAKYGFPGDMPQGIGTLDKTARDMFR